MRPEFVLALAMSALVPGGCEHQSAAAKQALDHATQAVGLAAMESAQFFPQRLQSVQRRLAREQDAFSQQHYGDVLKTAPAIAADARELVSDAAARKDELIEELTIQWGRMAATVPPLLKAARDDLLLQSRVASAPTASVRSAQSALANASVLWQQAEMSVAAGRIEDGLKMAQQARQAIADLTTISSAH